MALLKSFLGYFPISAISDDHCLALLLLFRKGDYSESFGALVILSTVLSIAAIVSTFVSSVRGISLLNLVTYWDQYTFLMVDDIFGFWTFSKKKIRAKYLWSIKIFSSRTFQILILCISFNKTRVISRTSWRVAVTKLGSLPQLLIEKNKFHKMHSSHLSEHA